MRNTQQGMADRSPRGTAVVASVVVLVIIQLTVVGAILTAARDQDLTVQRLDTTRAFYAAESGLNMAVRETIRGVDEDLDGAVGSVSSDGNAGNDPSLQGARFAVSSTLASGVATLDSAGRSGQARRRTNTTVDGVTQSLLQTVMTGFGRNNSNQPRYSVWNGTTWSASQPLAALSAEPKWVRMKICPTRNETCMIIETENDHVYVYFYNGTGWSAPYLLSTDTGGTNDRPEDLAYEQLSSNAVCIYWKGTSSTFGYRRYNGTTFLSEQTLASPFTTEADFVTLFPRPASNDIVLLSADGIAGAKLAGTIWNGSSWSSWTTLVASLESNNQECYSMAYETLTGRGLAVYIESGLNTPRYRTLTGTTWSSQGTLPNIGAVGKWVRLAADPTSNSIAFAALDGNNDLNVNFWNGSAWGANTEFEANCVNFDRRQFDVAYDRGTGKALLVYTESGLNAFRYRVWNGTSWSAEASGPTLGSVPQIITLSRGVGSGELVVACSDASMRLHLVRWDGSAMGADTVIESALSGQVQYYSFAVPEPSVTPYKPRVEGFAEVMP